MRTGLSRSRVAAILWCGAIFIIGCSGANSEKLPGFFASIYQDEPVIASLAFDLDSVTLASGSEKEVNGVLTVLGTDTIDIPIEIRARGITRKKICDFPPLRIQLKKAAIEEHHWGEYQNYKLVTHCSDTLRAEELLLREYLVYKMYEQLTGISLRTQLINMRYLTPGDTLQHFAFLIENEQEMNDRLGLQELDVSQTQVTSVNLDSYQRFVMFQYMVGNTDWNLSEGHNTKYVIDPETRVPVVLPYDFDYCGLVNASYARPYPSLPIHTVRERYFMYRGNKEDDFSAVVNEFQDKKTVWFSIIQQFPYLSEAVKQDMLGFLGGFFDIIESPGWQETLFTRE